MNPITFILGLLLFQAICVAGAAVFYASRKGENANNATSPISSQDDDFSSLYQSDSELDGYAINTDPGVTMDSVFRN